MLKAYFDETGIHKGAAVTALGGYVGSKADWTAVEEKFNEVLADLAHKGVTTFHMTDAIAQKGEFALSDRPTINYALTQISQVLGKTKAAGIFSAVVVDHWNAVVKDQKFLARYPHPIDLCFDNLVQNLALWATKNAAGEPVAPMFAYSSEFSPRMAEIGRLYGAQDWYKKVLGPVAFDYPARVVPLQAADLFIHQIGWDIEKRAFGPHDLASGGQTFALEWATGGRYTPGNWFDANGLLLTIKRFNETGKI